MKKQIIQISIVSLLLLLTGCEKKEKSKETFRSYEYFESHTKEMLARVKECDAIDYIKSKVEHEECDSVYRLKYIYDIEHGK